MKLKYSNETPGPCRVAMYAMINKVLEQFKGQTLTVRQLFYRLVGSGWVDPDPLPIPKTKPRRYPEPGPFVNHIKRYNLLTAQVKEARERGYVDWDLIKDDLKKVVIPDSFDSPEEILEAAVSSYRRDRQENQPTHIELWGEKKTLAGVLEPWAWKFGIPVLASMGEFSTTCLWRATMRLLEDGRPVVILYVGDFDPSGVNSVEQNIRNKLLKYSAGKLQIEVRRIAITKEQALRLKLPPAMTKKEDTRTAGFVEEHGDTTWEVEALPPGELERIIEAAIEGTLEKKVYQDALDQEAEELSHLKELIKETSDD